MASFSAGLQRSERASSPGNTARACVLGLMVLDPSTHSAYSSRVLAVAVREWSTPRYIPSTLPYILVDLPTLYRQVSQQRCLAFLDTGAVHSFIHRQTAMQAGLIPTVRNTGVTSTGPSGEQVTISLMKGRAPLHMDAPTVAWDLWVTPVTHPFIPGYDFVRAQVNNREVQTRILKWRHTTQSARTAERAEESTC